MAHPILMPKPGQMTEECTLILWRKAVGEPVHRGDVLFEIETDKSAMEVETFEEGVLLAQLVGEGESAPVNAICGWIGQAGEAVPDAAPRQPAGPPPADAPAPAGPTPPGHDEAAGVGPVAAGQARATPIPPPAMAPPRSPGAAAESATAVSPRARRRAERAGIDPHDLRGSGPGGRVVERDVLAAMTARAHGQPAAPPVGSPAGEGEPQPMSRMRQVIARRLTESWTTTPHFTITVAIDAAALMATRARLKADGSPITVTDVVLAATAATLAEFPEVNGRTDGTSVWSRRRVHLGLAVAVPGGLVVPVIRDADTLTLSEIHEQAAHLAAAARAGTASPDDLSGSTFTVSNLGMYGVEAFSAIVNPGEAAILAVSAAIPTPVAIDGAVEIRPVMKLTLSADHRLIDGETGARFMRALQTHLEAPEDLPLGVPAAAETSRPRFPEDPDWFDVVVLGAGTGGYTAAFRAAQLGLKVALVDEDKIGGTCLHRGCIPTKAILESAELAHRVREGAASLGVVTTVVGLDYAATAANKDAVVTRMWTGLKGLVGRNHVTWIAGRGRLDGPGGVTVTLEDGSERSVRANDLIVATGSRVRSLPGLTPDGTRIVTSDDVLGWTALPGRMIVVGAGAVGCEFASALHDLGVEITLLEYLPDLVPLEDHAVSRELRRAFERRGIRVITEARFDPAAVVSDVDGVAVTVTSAGAEPVEIRADVLLVATGRAANIEDIGLETTRAVVDRGFVQVDGLMRTAEPHVWAIGDLVGGLLLAHTAAHEGLIAAHAIAGERDVEPMDYERQPRATYTRPEVASVGLTEAQCVERGLPFVTGTAPFGAIAKALIHGSRDGFAKVIAHADSGAVLGVHIIGPHATELIAEASLGASLGATVDQLAGATHPHPTLSEALGEAAMAVRGRSINC